MQRHVSIAVAGVAAVLGLLALRSPVAPRPAAADFTPPVVAAVQPEPAAPPAALPLDVTLSWLAVGGGAHPASTQTSLEADVAAAGATLAGQGATFFAAGSGALVVAEGEVPEPAEGDAAARARRLLATLLVPTRAQPTGYRPVQIDALAADGGNLSRVLLQQVERGGAPLLVYASAHGERADQRRDVRLPLWGGEAWTPESVATALDAPGRNRPVRFVLGACFSGAFAEIAFSAADPAQGVASAERCGLFASTWDLESSGCDPDPDRRHHEGYGRHFWAALRRQDREGRPLAAAEVDFDGDGRISLLDAHTRVRIASAAFDVPTTTSERFLRSAIDDKDAPKIDAAAAASLREVLPHELAVLAALAAQLRLDDPIAAADQAYEDRDALIAEAEQAESRARAAEDVAAAKINAAILARWPNLDDPWRDDFEPTLARDASAILALIEAHPAFADWTTARREAAAAGRIADRALVARAVAERVVRAASNLRLAAALRTRDDAAWRHFLALRRCESFVPALREPQPAHPRRR